jgi:hypothetical protein
MILVSYFTSDFSRRVPTICFVPHSFVHGKLSTSARFKERFESNTFDIPRKQQVDSIGRPRRWTVQ